LNKQTKFTTFTANISLPSKRNQQFSESTSHSRNNYLKRKLIADSQIHVHQGCWYSAAAVAGAGGWLQTAALTGISDSYQPLRYPAQIQKEQVGIAALDWEAPHSLCLQMVGSQIGSGKNLCPEPDKTRYQYH
jgi:hypothetical protein